MKLEGRDNAVLRVEKCLVQQRTMSNQRAGRLGSMRISAGIKRVYDVARWHVWRKARYLYSAFAPTRCPDKRAEETRLPPLRLLAYSCLLPLPLWHSGGCNAANFSNHPVRTCRG